MSCICRAIGCQALFQRWRFRHLQKTVLFKIVPVPPINFHALCPQMPAFASKGRPLVRQTAPKTSLLSAVALQKTTANASSAASALRAGLHQWRAQNTTTRIARIAPQHAARIVL
jgi:hypothetical protein